jgi:hypothetical protein
VSTEPRLDAARRAVCALAPAILAIEDHAPSRALRQAAIDRGYFLPDEDERLRAWFGRYLTARAGLLETIQDLRASALGRANNPERRLRAFVLAYTAACLLVRAGRVFVDEIADHEAVQRKLNEPAPRYRIPRKQYTRIYRSLTHPAHAWRLNEAMRYADARRPEITALARDEAWADILTWLDASEDQLRIGVRRYFRARLRYRWHSWRWRRASAGQRALFALAEISGRVIADMRNPWHRHRVTPRVRARLADLIRPGDVLITRHDDAVSNLFLPGYWPHAALHLGARAVQEQLGIAVPEPQASRWIEPLCMLEARKDGVRFRALDDTLSVDAVAVLRPLLEETHIAAALANGIEHEGKLYNFDFDFFTADRLVCTEVVYRAYDGVGDLRLPLTSRAGRPTLSAEDLIRCALDRHGFEPVAVYGTPGSRRAIRTGAKADAALRRTADTS